MPLLSEIDVSAWKAIPVDGVGYVDSAEFLTWNDTRVRAFIREFEATRYGDWRNAGNLWRSTLGLDTTHGKRILDYGCGFGIEALQFCKSGNEVVLSDIHLTNVEAAKRVLRISGYEPAEPGKVDIFYSNGVLHHTPHIREILKEAVKNLNPGGEIRLLLYSDRAWTIKTGSVLPPIEADVTEHPCFPVYVRAMDAVGEYADWYNREKLEMRVGDFLEVLDFNYITPNGIYATTHLRPRA
jgi:SAM-dependent methyltransferase